MKYYSCSGKQIHIQFITTYWASALVFRPNSGFPWVFFGINFFFLYLNTENYFCNGTISLKCKIGQNNLNNTHCFFLPYVFKSSSALSSSLSASSTSLNMTAMNENYMALINFSCKISEKKIHWNVYLPFPNPHNSSIHFLLSDHQYLVGLMYLLERKLFNMWNVYLVTCEMFNKLIIDTCWTTVTIIRFLRFWSWRNGISFLDAFA